MVIFSIIVYCIIYFLKQWFPFNANFWMKKNVKSNMIMTVLGCQKTGSLVINNLEKWQPYFHIEWQNWNITTMKANIEKTFSYNDIILYYDKFQNRNSLEYTIKTTLFLTLFYKPSLSKPSKIFRKTEYVGLCLKLNGKSVWNESIQNRSSCVSHFSIINFHTQFTISPTFSRAFKFILKWFLDGGDSPFSCYVTVELH